MDDLDLRIPARLPALTSAFGVAVVAAILIVWAATGF